MSSRNRWLQVVPEHEDDLPTSDDLVGLITAVSHFIGDHASAPPPEVNVYREEVTLTWSARLHHKGAESTLIRKVTQAYGGRWHHIASDRRSLKSSISMHGTMVTLYIHLPETFEGKELVMSEIGLG